MKVVILAGGYGTRLSERTNVIPKPMVEVGGFPLLWHIMNLYSRFGFNDFIIAGGYKVEVIKDYFLNFHALSSDFTVNLFDGSVSFLDNAVPNWKVTVVDTGKDTMTGGRILRLKEYIGNESFHLTYGDGLSDLDLGALVNFHHSLGCLVTVTAVHPKAHYGELDLEGDKVINFLEKPEFRQSWINGGFMVINPEIFEFIEDDNTILEREPLEKAAAEKNLAAYKHSGFWQCMDTLRDLNYLNELYSKDSAPWVV